MSIQLYGRLPKSIVDTDYFCIIVQRPKGVSWMPPLAPQLRTKGCMEKKHFCIIVSIGD